MGSAIASASASFGESGPLVMSYAALEDYYQEQGRLGTLRGDG
ncbi:hypothetical protein OK016_11645 [Vibrio chagasii]|nr:hypothetical protein [Vibrio chagasii]